MEQSLSEAPPDLELLSAVEQDMARVDQALRDLDDDAQDPNEVIAWLPAPAVGSADAVDDIAPEPVAAEPVADDADEAGSET